MQIGGEMQKLAEKVQVLKQEQILPPEKAQVLEKDLDRIRQEALGKDPAKTMEAIDHLEQSFSKSAAEAAESAIKQTEAASRAQELAQALSEAQGQDGPQAVQRGDEGAGPHDRAGRRGEPVLGREPFRRASGSLPAGRLHGGATQGACRSPEELQGCASEESS